MSSEDQVSQSELDALKARADLMGITYHPNIGLDKLRAKVNAKLDGAEPTEEGEESPPVVPAATAPAASSKPPSPAEQERARVREKRQEAAKLVRVRITCMNPNKREWEGELFSVGNAVVGTFKKYVPFDVEWHVPQFVLNMIQQRKCQVFFTGKDARGNNVRKGKLVKEFAVEILPQLSPAELKELAQRQAMAGGTVEAA